MEMTPVASSNIEAVGFDEDLSQLHIRFHSGQTYIYDGVPRDLFEDLMMAASLGSFFNREIKPNFGFVLA